ncbi:MAG: glycosyltransferase family 2 protein [Gemmobacter sp.]
MGEGLSTPGFGGGFIVVTTMKNEGAFLIEWAAHYLALGFDRLVICTNDCADPTAAMAARLEQLGLARHHATRIWPAAGIQRSALKQVRRYEEVAGAAWIFVCDADEFLVIRDGDGSVRALAEGAGDHEVVTVAWRTFGPDRRIRFEDRPVTQQFTRAEAPPGAVTYGKSLFRGLERVHRIGIHGPVPRADLGRDLRRWFPGGVPYARADHPTRIRPDWSRAQVNHYALRSLDSFFVKRDRGRVNHAREDMGVSYWRRFDLAEVDCTAIRRYDATVAGWTARLRADPELDQLHRAAVDWHRARAAALAAQPAYRTLRAVLEAEGRI